MLKLALGSLLALVMAVSAACTVDQGGVVGASDEASAAVSAERLCSWRHRTNFDEGPPVGSRGVAQCGSNRQTYNTCDVVLYATSEGSYRVEAEDHGQNYCNALAQANCHYCTHARGVDFVFYLRLDNPARRWHQNFVKGDPPTFCDRYFNGNGQHILRCVNIQGNPPGPWGGGVLPRVGEGADLGEQRAKVRQACLGQVLSEKCARASTVAYRQLDRATMKRYLRWRVAQ